MPAWFLQKLSRVIANYLGVLELSLVQLPQRYFFGNELSSTGFNFLALNRVKSLDDVVHIFGHGFRGPEGYSVFSVSVDQESRSQRVFSIEEKAARRACKQDTVTLKRYKQSMPFKA